VLYIDLQYFPCVNYIATLCKAGEVDFQLQLPFRKSSFRNRMIIAGAGGPIQLSIPIVGSRSIKFPYDQIQIDNRTSWQRDHFRTLVAAYGNSPFFFHYRDEIESLFSQKTELLYEWNMNCLNWILKKLKLNDQIVITASGSSDPEDIGVFSDMITPANYKKHEPILKYPQVFEDRVGFLSNLSTLDMLFNVGPEAGKRLSQFPFELKK
jgi:hypothetical protein